MEGTRTLDNIIKQLISLINPYRVCIVHHSLQDKELFLLFLTKYKDKVDFEKVQQIISQVVPSPYWYVAVTVCQKKRREYLCTSVDSTYLGGQVKVDKYDVNIPSYWMGEHKCYNVKRKYLR